MKKFFFNMFIAVIMATVCAGCDGDSSKSKSELEEASTSPFVGSWKCNQRYYSGNDYYTFGSDGNFTWSCYGFESQSGRWYYNEKSGTLSLSKSNGTTDIYIITALTDSHFVMMDEDGYGYTYYKQSGTNSNTSDSGNNSGMNSGTTSSDSDSGTNNGHAYIDLGLSVKWATMNVGASSPEDYGDYFAWGETTTKTTYSWSTYKWCLGTHKTLTKYITDSSYGTVDGKTTLDLNDDAARQNWGGTWRMPTYEEQEELRIQCTWTWTIQNGINGYKVMSKTNSNSIFLPAAGARLDSSLDSAGARGEYWSSSLPNAAQYLLYSTPNAAQYLYFYLSNEPMNFCGLRYAGHSIRPVCQ